MPVPYEKSTRRQSDDYSEVVPLIQQMQAMQLFQTLSLIGWLGVQDKCLLRQEGSELRELQHRIGKGRDDFIRAGLSETVGRFGELLRRAPEADDDPDLGKLRAQLAAEVAGVHHGGGGRYRDADNL